MAPVTLRRLVTDASPMLCAILRAERGAVPAPIRSEIFGPLRFAEHGRSLADTHRSARPVPRVATFFPRLQGNIGVLREAHRYIGEQAGTGYDISPAAEWLLDNFHLIEAQLEEVHAGLPRDYFRGLPVLRDEPLAGLPRIYGVAWAFVAHTDGAFDDDLLLRFLDAYQERCELTLGELWALPTTLRVVLVENLRRLAERVATHKAAREVANLCSDHLVVYSSHELDQVQALMAQRGVARAYLAQMSQRMRERSEAGPDRWRDWLGQALPDPAALLVQQSADQTADNLSVSNAVTSLRAIGDADWTDIVTRTSVLMRRMLTSPLFEAEHTITRDQTLHGIERLARRSRRSEVEVAQTLLDLMHGGDESTAVAAHWLHGPGQPQLAHSVGLSAGAVQAWRGLRQRLTLPAYLGALLLGSLGLAAWLLLRGGEAALMPLADGLAGGALPWLSLLTAALLLLPASEAVVALVNRLISESVPPRHLPRLALAGGIPPEHRVMVVIPAMLTSAAATARLLHRLHLHQLANPEAQAQFALLTDWADADSAALPADEALLGDATRQVAALNAAHAQALRDLPAQVGGSIASDAGLPAAWGDGGYAPRFILLQRGRRFSVSEQRWIGWERKRGKLEDLVSALVQGRADAFLDLGEASRLAAGVRYIVTLDSDTQLPPGRLRELVGVAAHPHNQPRLAADARSVVSGFGILQPRIVTPLPSPREVTPFHWLFAGQCGIDAYSAASSDVYQDLFGEGSFSGKGLLNVQAMHAVLANRLPEGQVLSHDLLEGALARCAAVSDITVVEEAPFHADVAASRVHRWTRGDWQLLPFLIGRQRRGLRPVNRWKLFDNLRRSLVAPAALALLLLALATSGVSPWAVLALLSATFAAGPLMGALAGALPGRSDLARLPFFRQVAIDLARAVSGAAWHLALLLQHALLSVDAIVRALFRMAISHRLLLQWTTAETVQAASRTTLAAAWRRHWSEPVLALLLLAGLGALPTPHPLLAIGLCLLWAASPLWTWWASRPHPAPAGALLPIHDQRCLEGVARDTWRLFERCVGPEDHHLPPDNLQTAPHDMVARRTSPTNIGLYLLSVACAREFGWIGTQDLLARMEATLGTLNALPRHRGHFLNWYDTGTLAPLLPMYVSTVDSGNLSGHLLAVAEACRELAGLPDAPGLPIALHRALRATRGRIARLTGCEAAAAARAAEEGSDALAQLIGRLGALPPGAALVRLLALPDALAQARRGPAAFHTLLDEAAAELTTQWAPPAAAAPDEALAWCLADHLATLRSAARDVCGPAAGSTPDTAARLRQLAAAFERLAWQADFHFLYDGRRHLFHIGYRLEEQQLDTSYYDLLASESRLTSLLAIAKGDVPVRHWAALGRPFFAVGAQVGLRSWAGSMFEYLMPSLVLEEPEGSVLREACRVALHEQIAFAADQGVPWGISESAYAAADHTLAYQYAPQGVPRLALRRTPPDELVVAPYATALAALVSPQRACLNFARLDALAAHARYGFIEALDFSSARRAGPETAAPVATFMAHHQGMSIVALANVLLDGVAQRWGMANPRIEAVATLLHERAPRAVSMLHVPRSGPPPLALLRRAPALLREVLPGATAVQPTHLLSNGRYSVTLRANGAGWSRWGGVGITRWRDDALRDALGSFFYLRWDRQPAAVSITQHPAPDAGAHYRSVFHADRVCFDATWPQLQAHTTVWVSPEDDIEFRQVELRNLSARALEIELLSAFEVTLAEPRADEAHPAFGNLFVSARWQPAQEALLFERTPRLPSEQALQVAHFLAESDPQVVAVQLQADRQRWLGRNRAASQPLADLAAPPELDASAGAGALVEPGAAVEAPGPAAVLLETGLDPVCAMAVRLRIAPHAKARLTFATAASDQRGVLRSVIDKYRQASHVQRASLMSATLAGVRLRALHVNAENFATLQTLTTALLSNLTRAAGELPAPAAGALRGAPVCDRRLLWRFGISGDHPILLVLAGVPQGLGLLRSLIQALRLWSWGGIACDVVVVNAEPASYELALHRQLATLREGYLRDTGTPGRPPLANLHMLRADEVPADVLSTLHRLARLRLHADGRPLRHHLQAWIDRHEGALEQRQAVSTSAVTAASGQPGQLAASQGLFALHSGEFRFDVSATQRPTRPWINVLANPAFGAQISEAGGGYTWAGNSRLNQLTAWSNDPVADPPAEHFLVQDGRTLEVWSVAPSAWGDARATYHVLHGQGYSVIRHRRGELEVIASWCVDAATRVKQVRMQVINHGKRSLPLRLIGMAEWLMGAQRGDRATVHTAAYRPRLPALHEGAAASAADGHGARSLTALLCTQVDNSAGFGGGTAFLALVGAPDESDPGEDWTCDRRECFDARGALVIPDHFGQHAGSGLDPCAALALRLSLAAGASTERVFLLGHADTVDGARQLVTEAALVSPARRLQRVRHSWDELLGATLVKTPDPLFDVLVNRWLLYQAVACRMWAKAGFYQAGGATGFRDQLQDAMALAWAAPVMLREQILRCAARQFVEGDVQHWWHAPGGAGVRTHFSDDLLWLPHACSHYLQATGDAALLDEMLPFLDGVAIPEGAEDVYNTPPVSDQQATLYEHAARSIDRSLRVGVHGLPLMGSGDWNDGMNRVGSLGRGESVWLGWFLCRVVADFAPLAHARGDEARAARWEAAARGWLQALETTAWDGLWYTRAYFDDGQPLGAQANPEARIDLIAQAWSVLSGSGRVDRQHSAMAAVRSQLFDEQAGLVRLLTPPLVHAQPSAGYIQAYPPGVRENGGQYSHAGAWAVMAQAGLACSAADPAAAAEAGDLAYRYFTGLSPAHRAAHPTQGPPYGLEPYVMAGDVHSQPPYTGRGGWSWYTGAAAWMHRAAIESLFGLRLHAHSLSLLPCLPSNWPRAELALRRPGRAVHIVLMRASPAEALAALAGQGARLLLPGEVVAWADLPPAACLVMALALAPPEP